MTDRYDWMTALNGKSKVDHPPNKPTNTSVLAWRSCYDVLYTVPSMNVVLAEMMAEDLLYDGKDET